ncbi:ArsC family reductase [Thauera sp. Sel9]|uniref:ArsC family reductase n=1 Tax=Thauera sp. Sel9 TaxID=2974299 RepID=UPI0021E0FED4|nr:ArsC family reductase [Thauera sp. Sel9]MCV2219567.1 ArsC family reductase [Thauera sp. Sel9]
MTTQNHQAAGKPACRVYGIKNCDTMKKAFAWLDAAGIAYDFHDYKKSGIDTATLAHWCGKLGWEALVNKRGTTWRKLSPEQQAISSTEDAIALMQANTSLIRRPVVETAAGELLVGFDPERFASALKEAAR